MQEFERGNEIFELLACGDLVSASQLILQAMPLNEEKLAERKALLAQQPELQIHVDTQRLRAIVPYVNFKCHRRSSIARNEAILGSDIDDGLVVTQTPVDPDTQQAFVDELRNQGFTAYTEQEREEIKTKYEDSEKDNLLNLNVDADWSTIFFRTVETLEKLVAEKNLDQRVPIFLAGLEVQ